MRKKSLFASFITVLCFCFSSFVFAAADGWASQNGGATGGQDGTLEAIKYNTLFVIV